MRSACAILLLLAGVAIAAEPTPPPAPKVAAPAKTTTPGKAKVKAEATKELSEAPIPEEERWVFEPPAGRPDVFVDIEAKLELERKLLETPSSTTVAQNVLPSGDAAKIDAAVDHLRATGVQVQIVSTRD